MDVLKEYYRKYYQREGDHAYTMESHGGTSRVLQILDWVSEYVPKGGKILDVGCGDMYLSTFPTGHSWTGIDINTSKAKGEAVEHDLMDTPYPFPDSSFDGVVCSETLEHLFDARIVHKEVHRLLKPGGAYIVTTPNFDWIDHHLGSFRHLLWEPETRAHTSEHIRQYNLQTHERDLKKAGFEILDFTGADAQYGVHFQGARVYLKALLLKLGLKDFEYDGRVDQVLGRAFPTLSHTICIASRKAST